MKKKEFVLSDNIVAGAVIRGNKLISKKYSGWIFQEDVKEFIRLLKEKAEKISGTAEVEKAIAFLITKINTLAGKELVE